MSSKEILCNESHTSSFDRYKREYLVSITAALCMLNVGINSGWPGPIIGILTEPNSEFHIELPQTPWLSSIYALGCVIGALIGFYLTNHWSRSKTVLITSVPFAIGYLIFMLYQEINCYYAGRFIIGIAAGISFGAVPMYVAEIASTEIRGFLVAILPTACGVGVVVVYAVMPLMNLTTVNYLFLAIAIAQFICCWFIPESPIFLLTANRNKEAKEVLIKLRGSPNVDAEFARISNFIQLQTSQPASFAILFTDPIKRRALLLAFLTLLSQHLSGGVALLTYSQRIFDTKVQFLSKDLSGFIFSVCKLIPMFTSGLIIEKFGRKPLLVISAVGCAIPLCLLGLYFHFEELGNDFVISKLSFTPLVMLLLHIGFFGIGVGSLPGTYASEIIASTSIRPHCFCAISVVGGFVSFSTIQIFNKLDVEFGKGCPMFFFAGCSLIIGILMLIFLLETAGRTFDEIEKKLARR